MFRAKHTPSLQLLLENLPTSDVDALCKHLDITPQTVRRWRQAGHAPRMAMLAMFYETHWGFSLINTTAQNGEMYARQECEGLRNANAALRGRVARLEALGGFESANAPFVRAL